MLLDGLEDAYDKGHLMGVFAEMCADEFHFTRADQDAFAVASLERAKAANERGAFDWEIAPVTVSTRQGELSVSKDEQPYKARLDKIASLKPAFRKDGTVTAANASSISDGAAALVMMRDRRPRGAASCRSRASPDIAPFAQAPDRFTTAPVGRESRSCWPRPAGRRTRSISMKSTRHSRSSRWPRCASTGSPTRRSMCMAGPVHSAIRSAHRVRASS